ncbi:hypothetical protein P9112_000495 [Eukaryota sp. TZLM1-RC]
MSSHPLQNPPLPSKKSKRLPRKSHKRRERAFDTSFSKHKLPSYQPLQDMHSVHFFSNPSIQKQLIRNGLIDSSGRLVPQGRVEAALRSIDRELSRAERMALEKAKDEHYNQKKREAELKRARERELVRKRAQDARERLLAKSKLPRISQTAVTEAKD